jgi:hypothetical protein
MSFFSGFPQVNYKFGNEEYSVLFENISAYVDLIDRLKEDTSFYTTYTILEGDRPDVVSHNLYETSVYYWTFFFLNDHLRQEGWPLTSRNLKEKIKKDYSGTTIVSRNELHDLKFSVGREIIGITSGTTATIKRKNLNLGQIVVEETKSFIDGESIEAVLTDLEINSGQTAPSFTVHSSSEEYNSAFYYTLNDEIVDIDPFVGPGALLNEVTYLDYFTNKNNENKNIKVLRPDVVTQVFTAYKKELTGL